MNCDEISFKTSNLLFYSFTFLPLNRCNKGDSPLCKMAAEAALSPFSSSCTPMEKFPHVP